MSKRFKREEPLRYEFARPVDTTFRISQLKGESFESKSAKGVLLNISPGGLRLMTDLDLPKGQDILLTFDIQLGGHALTPEGEVVWKEKRGNSFIYGIDFSEDPELEKTVFAALKAYAVHERNETANRAAKRRRPFDA
ncbi:PilZ domain-containing protein [Salisediminibacterium selenitireducens]|uniref:Type IV pilus assembly PilZ n=1 Tax=Bacillus selenitireducens (strain ATCC 700615 / DSM 15326 / MLS10) TaxID=439292 RepID=D6Y1E7_BACIE|nr:PilZ domain-containing protein [Salisediminibacterium selenitireducens]ADI00734.1 type IV pilus assembly PilZ [[Bacillus] selenitireducens MLS10]